MMGFGDSSTVSRLEIIRPDDFHLHLRTGTLMRLVLGHTSAVFGRAVVMPNLSSPVDTVEKVLDYKKEILSFLSESHSTGESRLFEPLMTLYLREDTSKTEVLKAKREGIIGIKYLP